MKPGTFLGRLVSNEAGISTAEFAMVGPAALMMMIGGMYVSMLGFTAASLRYATQQGARCASVNSTLCGDAAATQTYALSQFRNISGGTATFTASDQTCGKQVTGSITYMLEAGTWELAIPISASACFP